jgi:hypothetical protein
MTAREAAITNGIRIPASVFTATRWPQERQCIVAQRGNVLTAKSGNVWIGKGGKEIDPRRPRHRHCLSAKTTSAPVFFDMLLKGSP